MHYPGGRFRRSPLAIVQKKLSETVFESGWENSLFQETIIRNMPFCDEFYIVTNADYAMVVEGQIAGFRGLCIT